MKASVRKWSLVVGLAGLALTSVWLTTPAEQPEEDRAVLLSQLRLRQTSIRALERRLELRRKAEVLTQYRERLLAAPLQPHPALDVLLSATATPRNDSTSNGILLDIVANDSRSTEQLSAELSWLDSVHGDLKARTSVGASTERDYVQLRQEVDALLRFHPELTAPPPAMDPTRRLQQERELERILEDERALEPPRSWDAPDWERLLGESEVPEPEWIGVPMFFDVGTGAADVEWRDGELDH